MSETLGGEVLPPNYYNCVDVNPQCPVEVTIYGDYLTLGACIFFVAAHTILLGAQGLLGWRSRAWSFTTYLGLGTLLEVAGYAARVALSQNPWTYDAFVIQLVMLILAPTLVAASISVTFKHLVLWYGPEWSFMRPALYPWVFVGADFFSIIIQAVGGVVSALATGSETPNVSLLDTGSGLLIAGVVFQLANMVCCGGLMLLYFWRRNRGLKSGPARLLTPHKDASGLSTPFHASGVSSPQQAPIKPSVVPDDKKVTMFLSALSAAYIAIIIRCIYRIPEQATGWGSDLMQNETLFLILDGAMILISILLLTVFHPHFYFPLMGKGKDKKSPVDVQTSHDEIEMGQNPHVPRESDRGY